MRLGKNESKSISSLNVSIVLGFKTTTSSAELIAEPTIPAIMNAMTTWDEITCSKGLYIPFGGIAGDVGYVQYLFGFGGVNGYYPGVIVHGGILASGFFDAIAGGGGMLTVPTLLASGLPPHVALGTNKLASTFGSSIASYTFYKKKFPPNKIFISLAKKTCHKLALPCHKLA